MISCILLCPLPQTHPNQSASIFPDKHGSIKMILADFGNRSAALLPGATNVVIVTQIYQRVASTRVIDPQICSGVASNMVIEPRIIYPIASRMIAEPCLLVRLEADSLGALGSLGGRSPDRGIISYFHEKCDFDMRFTCQSPCFP